MARCGWVLMIAGLVSIKGAHWPLPEDGGDLLGAGEARAQGAAQCFERAQTETLLSEEDSIRLCCGLNSVEPVECYERARDETVLTDAAAIELCQCAPSPVPLNCYVQTQTQTTLNEDQAVELCKQTLTPVLSIPQTPPVKGVLPEERATESLEEELSAQRNALVEDRDRQQSGPDSREGEGGESALIDRQLEIIEQERELLRREQELLEILRDQSEKSEESKEGSQSRSQ